MGLIHWWPLNGDKNDHAGNLDLTSSSSTFVEGKINKALQLNGVIAKVANPFIGLNDWSISFWLKDNDSSAWSDFICFSKNLIRLELDNASNWRWYLGNASTGETFPATGNLFSSGTILNSGASANTWYHVTIVKKNTNAKFYLDGILKNTSTAATNFTSESATMYFNSRANETTSSKMSLCDVRCYDHALSEAEVHELKSGLLLHYNFEDYTGQSNLKTDPNNWSSSYSCDGSGATKGSFTVQSDGSVLVVDNNTNTRFYSSQRIPVKVGDKFTFSIKYKLVSGTGETFRWQISEWNSSGTRVKLWWSQDTQKVKDLSDGWKLYYYHFTVGASDAAEIRFYLQDGADYTNYTHSYYLRDFKLEKGHTDNPIFETTEYSTEYDCSGNEHNAVVNGVQNKIEAATGAHSAYFLDGGQWLEHTGAAFSNSTLSVAFWWKSSCAAAKTGYHIPFAIDGGRVEISIPNNGQLRWGGYINGSRKCDNVTCKDANGNTFSLNNGKWHHIVSVFDGTGFSGYVDGIYQGKQSGSGTITYTSKVARIGKYNAGATSDYGATDAYISDVRVYNTVLNTDDIVRLYNNTVKVTPEQVMIGSYLVEAINQIDFYDVDAWIVAGHGCRKQLVEDGIELTALNGWESFAITTPSHMIGKKIIFSFDYKWTSNTRGNSGECSVWSKDSVYYHINSGALMVSDTSTLPTGQWAHVTAVIDSASTYTGFMNRGKDESGKVYGLICRNFSLQLATESEVKIYPTGVVTVSHYGDSNKTRIIKAGNLTASSFVEV